MICNVRQLDTESQAVRLLFGTDDDGMTNGNIEKPAVRITPTTATVLASTVAVVGVILTAGFSMFPFVMPSSSVPNSSLTAWDSVSSWRTLQIMFWVTVFFLPLIALYTSWAYAKLRGKITLETIRSEH